jgi:hypothetical protein
VVLADVDVLIDGPFVARLAHTAGSWTGSGNQRVIDLVATRRAGTVCLGTNTSGPHDHGRPEPIPPNRRDAKDGPPPTPGTGCEGWPGDCPDAAPATVVFEWRDWRSRRWRALRLCARCEQAFAPGVRNGAYRIRNRRALL